MTGVARPHEKLSRLSRELARTFGRMFAFCPLLLALVLAALWVRSVSVQERLIWKRSVGQVDPRAKQARLTETLIVPESGFGVGGVTWNYDDWNLSNVSPAFVERFEPEHRIGSGHEFGTTLTRKRLESDPYEKSYGENRLFGRRFYEEVGPWQTFHWVYFRERFDDVHHNGGKGPRMVACGEFAAPYWLLIAPCFLPMVWWLWCPSGRAFPRLTIKRLALVTACVALTCLILLTFVRASAHDRALSNIYYLGGNCKYDWSSGRNVLDEVAIVREIGAGGFDDASGIRLGQALAALPGVPKITIKSKTLTGAGLAWLSNQPDLEELWLAGTRADDRTLSYLRGHKKIREIGVGWTRVTDAGLADLEGMPRLEDLRLEDLPITDAGLAHLEGLPRLRVVVLTDSGINRADRISEEGVKRLFHATPSLQLLVLPDGRRMGRDGEWPASRILPASP